ncbi:sugar efflux transporter [Nucisporomicrobium flavum]|jgi:MFS transporter, SET family, sugar efflux transporter|uniref:sugar efflux transporter n=1 Tax=Nucisporomicrobium flavum TaxID=2785915 RepID=UPI0018F6D526|nr:sugar efflux transporter [Nucisporomicrobium flavum]
MALDTSRRTPQLARALLPLGLVFLAVGISTALVGPFLSLFLSTDVDAGPLQVTVFLVVAPLSGVLGSTLIGRLSDRRPIRRVLLVGGALAGMVGCAFTAVVRDYWVLLGLTVTAIAVANSLFPQSFAYARQVLERDAPERSAMGISALRTVFSLAWVAGPPLAAFLLDAGGFTWVYGGAAVMYALAAAVGLLWLREVRVPAAPATEHSGDGTDLEPLETPRWTLLLTATAFTLMQTPLTLAVQALPLFISTDLGGDVSDAGLVLGLCAALEIPLMLGVGALSTRLPLRLMVFAGAAFGVVYYATVAVSTSVWVLVGAQLFNALFIAAVGALGITYMQDMLPRHPGRATTLFTNSFPLGAMLAGPLFGLAQHFGYRLAYWMCTGLCAAGLLLLALVRQRRVTGAAG